MAATYEPIATQSVSGTASSVTFSSIPQTYTDLILVSNIISSSGAIDVSMRYNGDGSSTGLYSDTIAYGTGSSPGSGSYSNGNQSYMTYYGQPNTTGGSYNSISQFMNYSNASIYKTILVRDGNVDGGVEGIINLYRSTSAISSIYIFPQSSTFASGSTFTLYGIKAA